ncbi:MAG TPA: N,N-dimethylformamidase beta subunit family domain-containing protein, partial [Kamptonema sp.]|nr:N,N-dimethylformamidase beta subunit family domain-containing protein [Kamptonema sp.]
AHSPYSYKGRTRYADMTVYTAASGATVFATGSMQWTWGLDDYNAPQLRPSRLNSGAQQITRNVLAKMIKKSH